MNRLIVFLVCLLSLICALIPVWRKQVFRGRNTGSCQTMTTQWKWPTWKATRTIPLFTKPNLWEGSQTLDYPIRYSNIDINNARSLLSFRLCSVMLEIYTSDSIVSDLLFNSFSFLLLSTDECLGVFDTARNIIWWRQSHYFHQNGCWMILLSFSTTMRGSSQDAWMPFSKIKWNV